MVEEHKTDDTWRQIFKILWAEPMGVSIDSASQTVVTGHRGSQGVLQKIRRFIIVSNDMDNVCCQCV